MSMIGCFYAVNDKDLDAIVAEPKRVLGLLGIPAAPEPSPSLLGKLFGSKKPAAPATPPWQPSEPAEAFDVDKAWQGIHFLLTGSDWEGEGPAAFILHGGREINEDLGYGPPHGFSAKEVKDIANKLREFDPELLFNQAEPAKFEEMEIYPGIWTKEPKEESIGYVIDNFKNLREFMDRCAQKNRAVIAYLG